MDELIKQISAKTGISEDQARTAATTVIGFLKSKLPEPIAGQIDNALNSSSASGAVGDLASKVGGMLGS